MKILIINNLYPPQELGGYGRSMHDFGVHLSSMGHVINVLTSDAPYLGGTNNAESGICRDLHLLGTYQNGVKLLSDPRKCQHINDLNLRTLDRVLVSFMPDIVLIGNIDLLDSSLIQFIISRRLHCWHHFGFAYPNCHLEPGIVSSNFYHPLAGSQHTADAISSTFKFKNVPIVYPGANTSLFSGLFPIPLGGPLLIGYAGLLISSKGPHILLQALKRLSQLGVPFKCELAGDTIDSQDLNSLQRFVHSSGISDKVNFLGRLDPCDLIDFYSRQQIFVFPSIYPEGFGIVQVEALAAGLLVVSSGLGGACETVYDHLNGRRFKPDNVDSLVQVLLEIYKYPAEHEYFRAFGRRLASTHFDTRISSIKLSSLFQASI